MTESLPELSPRARWGVRVGLGVAVLALSVMTVLRYTVDFLQADGVQQSVMSIQDVDLFFWGQNRFAAFVSALASPIANPDANLFACLLINALSFHVLLLLLAVMGAQSVTGSRRTLSTAVLFGGLALVAHVMVAPFAMHVAALESQPYSMSWALTLGAFLLWKRQAAWSYVLAALMIAAAVGLNQSTILGAAFFAILEFSRRRQWVRWPLFGAVWVAMLIFWGLLSARFGGNAGPIPDANTEYFRFDSAAFVTGAPRSFGAVLGSLQNVWFVLASTVCLVLLPAERRSALLRRLLVGLGFALVYWVIFTGNPWVVANGYPFRYFFPVVVFVVAAVAAPPAALLVSWLGQPVRERAGRDPSSPAAVRRRLSRAWGLLAALVFAVGLSLAGPMAPPADAKVLVGTRPTGDFVRTRHITYITGYYWDMWPTLHRALNDGRHAAFVTAFKSGGDPAAYRQAFDTERAEGRVPQAICVNEGVDFCRTYLDYWTKPGWTPSGETCPAPPPGPTLGTPKERSCLVLRYSGA